jgi:hypothetical protein
MAAYLSNPPETDEYASFYERYVARVEAGDILDHLALQGDEIIRIFGEMDDERLGFRYAPGKWSARQVLGHLSDTERVMSYRALRVARGDSTPLPGFDENLFVAAADFDRRDRDTLLAEFSSVRAASLSLFASIGPREWLFRGVANDSPITPRALAWIIVGHVGHHLAILRERYRVG